MRLTLRTLLAYLDDILEPDQAREIGKKSSESPSASTLIGRIREVTRRRRLTAPSLSGPGMGLDPNVIAEYLDNTLAAEKVEEVEKVCMDSDVHLAEAAACHQILTLVLGEPVTVLPESRERMYALGATHVRDVIDGGLIEELSGTASTVTPTTVSPAPSFWKRVLPFVVVSLVVTTWLSLFYLDPPEPPVMKKQVAGEGEIPPESVPATPSPDQNVLTAPASDTDQASPPVGKTPLSAAALTPRTNPTDVTVGASPPDSAEPVPAGPVVFPEVQNASPRGILLRRTVDGNDWMFLPRFSVVAAGEQLASPEPFSAELYLDGTTGRLSLLGGTLVELSGTEDALCGIDLKRGRIILRAGPPGTGATTVPVFRLRVGQQEWRLEFDSPETVCGIEVTPLAPRGFEEPLQAHWYLGGLYVAAGAVRVTSDIEKVEVVAGAWFSLPVGADTTTPDESVQSELSSSVALPEWLKSPPRSVTSSKRKSAIAFEKGFDQQRPAGLDLLAMVKSSRPGVSLLAVECLALTGQVEPLVQALYESEFFESRAAAFDGLRLWVARRQERGVQLKAELEKFFAPEKAKLAYRLLWGYSRSDALSGETSRQLVDWLSHDHPAIRQMAFDHVSRLTGGRRYKYDPDVAPAQRQAAVQRWWEHLEKKGALVAP